MIAPSYRLLMLVLVCVFPAAVIGGVMPAMLVPAVAVVGVLLLLSLADLAFAIGRLDGVGAELPDLVRFTKDESGEITIKVTRKSGRIRSAIVGIALPRIFETESDILTTQLPKPDQEIRLNFKARPTRRGEYHLRECWLEGLSPVGLWRVRARRDADCRIRVYPNLFTERKALAALFLNRGALGVHARRQVGKGHEFEKLREYVSGDSYEDLHWKATARRGRPITKIFQVERTQEVYVVLDASRLSAREVVDTRLESRDGIDGERTPPLIPLLERYIRVALVLGMAAEKQGDRYGLITFSDRVSSFIRAGTGKAHYGVCRDAVYTLEPQRVAPDYDELFRFIRSRLNRRSLLVFLTHLDDPALAESFTNGIDLVCRKHVIVVNMLAPKEAAPLFTGAPAATADEVYRRLAGHLSWEGIRQLEGSLQVRGVRLKTLSHERMAPEVVAQYLEIKQRQIL